MNTSERMLFISKYYNFLSTHMSVIKTFYNEAIHSTLEWYIFIIE